MKNADRPKSPVLRTWLVKIRGLDEPIEVETEYRAAARHYGRVSSPLPPNWPKEMYREVEWARLKK